MHLPHRPGGPHEERHTSGAQLGAVPRFAVRRGYVGTAGADIRRVVVVDAPDVDVARPVERLISDEVHEAAEREGIARTRDKRCGPRAEHDDVVEWTADIRLVDNGDRGLGRARPDRRRDVVAQPRQHDLSRACESGTEVVGVIVIRTTDDPGAPAGRRREPPPLRVCRFHARPRLRQGCFRIAEPVADIRHVRAIVGSEDLRTDDVIANEAARDRVPVRGAPAIGIDVRLNGEALPRMEPVGKIATGGDHCHRGLVAKARRGCR